MYVEQESIFYYLTVMNEQYAMPPMPEGAQDGILKGMYRFSKATNTAAKLKAQLLGSGAILPEVIKAQSCSSKFGVAADVWSVTSYGELYRDGNACERWNMLHPAREAARALRGRVPRGRAGRHRRRVGLHEGAAGFDRSLAAAPHRRARHRRLRPKRGPRKALREFLRGRRAVHRCGGAVGAAREEGRSTRSSLKRRSRTWASIQRRRIPQFLKRV